MKATAEIYMGEVIILLTDLGYTYAEHDGITTVLGMATKLLQEYNIEYIRFIASKMREIDPPYSVQDFFETAKIFSDAKMFTNGLMVGFVGGFLHVDRWKSCV